MKTMTFDEWKAEGLRRFGDNQFAWQFKCPACGHVQTAEDFRKYKGNGATVETVRFNCIGRYRGAQRRAFGGEGEGPCDYTSGGLFDIRPLEVAMPDGHKIMSFEFADAVSHQMAEKG